MTIGSEFKNESANSLTETDGNNLEAYLDNALRDFKGGVIDKEKLVNGIVNIIRAIDENRYQDARMLLAQGRALLNKKE